jgi:hypothetical protein
VFDPLTALLPTLSLLTSDAPPASLQFLTVPFKAFGIVAARSPQDAYQYAIEFEVQRISEPPVWALLGLAAALRRAVRGVRTRPLPEGLFRPAGCRFPFR